MGYVPGFRWDVFVSYARDDDSTPFPGDTAWVSAFVTALKRMIGSYLGEDIELFFDRTALSDGNLLLEEMTAAAANSAIFVTIASPTYPKRKWTLAELAAFRSTCTDTHNLFVAERLPLDGEEYPDILSQIIRVEFWQRIENSPAPDPFSPSGEEFRRRLIDFAYKLKTRLRTLRAQSAEAQQAHDQVKPPPTKDLPQAPPPPEPARSALRTVLIAQGTDDVAGAVEEVRRYLEQFPDVVEVLPRGSYPQGGEAFREAFNKDLGSADIFVQLLGPTRGRTPPDLPDGYTASQLAAARAAGKEILQWRHPALMPEAIEDEDYRALFSDPKVIVSGFEEFKAQVLTRARGTPTEPPKIDHARVFVNADRANLITATGIADEFSAKDYVPMLPKFDGTVQENRNHLYQMMAECGIVLVVNGVRPPIWFDNQKRLFEAIRPTRKAAPDSLAVCTVPPADQLGPEMVGDEFVHIDCSDGYDPERVRNYIATLHPEPREPAA